MRQEKGTAKRQAEQFTLCVQNVSEIERCAGAKAPLIPVFVRGPKGPLFHVVIAIVFMSASCP